jgi:predicted NAD/FAD-binding protein
MSKQKEKIAVIGTGAAGLAAAYLLQDKVELTLFEKEPRCGGHAHTVTTPDGTDVDSGFIVYNLWTYPNLIALFNHLQVKTSTSTMSFSVWWNQGALYYAGGNLKSLFAQKGNLFRPRFWLLILELIRFYKHSQYWLKHNPKSLLSLGDYLKKYRYADIFIEAHLLPMAAAIWSTPDRRMLDFPAVSFLRFCRNHGLLNLIHRPEWRTVEGGSKNYIALIKEGFAHRVKEDEAVQSITRFKDHVTVTTAQGNYDFDQVILATHGDEALKLLSDPTESEQAILSCFTYSHNITYVHTDTCLMPRDKNIWSSWNYFGQKSQDNNCVFVTYWMNSLQPFLPKEKDLFVTLNPIHPPKDHTIIKTINYTHPQFDHAALHAQKILARIQGKNRTWFCGSYTGYGFHEDAIASGLAVAELLGAQTPWPEVQDSSPARFNTKGY